MEKLTEYYIKPKHAKGFKIYIDNLGTDIFGSLILSVDGKTIAEIKEWIYYINEELYNKNIPV
jgi:hypothetical protein